MELGLYCITSPPTSSSKKSIKQQAGNNSRHSNIDENLIFINILVLTLLIFGFLSYICGRITIPLV